MNSTCEDCSYNVYYPLEKVRMICDICLDLCEEGYVENCSRREGKDGWRHDHRTRKYCVECRNKIVSHKIGLLLNPKIENDDEDE
jgi:hypothetical protein